MAHASLIVVSAQRQKLLQFGHRYMISQIAINTAANTVFMITTGITRNESDGKKRITVLTTKSTRISPKPHLKIARITRNVTRRIILSPFRFQNIQSSVSMVSGFPSGLLSSKGQMDVKTKCRKNIIKTHCMLLSFAGDIHGMFRKRKKLRKVKKFFRCFYP